MSSTDHRRNINKKFGAPKGAPIVFNILFVFHLYRSIKCDGNHLLKGGLACFRAQIFFLIQMVGYGAETETALVSIGGVAIECCCLHLGGENAHALPFVIALLPFGIIEMVRGENIADMELYVIFLSGFNGGGEQLKVCNGGKVTVETEVLNVV